MDGTEEKAKGQYNETKGKVTNNTSEEMKGKAQKAKGSAEKKAQNLKNDVTGNNG